MASQAGLTVERAFAGTQYLEFLKEVSSLDEIAAKIAAGNPQASITENAAESIFNKFSIFKYSKFINGSSYEPAAHFIGYHAKNTKTADEFNQQQFQKIEDRIIREKQNLRTLGKKSTAGQSVDADITKSTKTIEDAIKAIEQKKRDAADFLVRNASTLANPTAANIIKWGAEQSSQSVMGFQPYSMTDFMFCKNYGKIPNNRLITLRRYPFPVEDQLRIAGAAKALIPVAQAVTWWGEGTDNKLSSIGVMKWNLKWGDLTVTEQTITGNEVTVDDLAAAFSKIKGLENLGKQLKEIGVGLAGKDTQLQELSGMEKNMQEYLKNLYTTNGPYWNRIYGPVNVIHQTTRRERGMQDGWNTPFTIKFHYSFRSFSGLSPKIVALDLIASFLNLTYNDAEFLHQLGRYFPRLGVKFDKTTTEQLGNILTSWATSFTGDNTADIMALSSKVMDALKATATQGLAIAQDAAKGDTTKLKEKALRVAQTAAISQLSQAVPNLLSIKAAQSDRPVGEWHLVVGNPLNPIMVMGDLVCTGCDMTFDEEMGPDDFPTGVTFDVKLRQGKPRDKVAIERMFNLGETKMMDSKLRGFSAAEDSFGESNNTMYAQLTKQFTKDELESIKKGLGEGAFEKYRARVRRAYGYAGDAGDAATQGQADPAKINDSILYMYYDRRQNKQ